ncbi:MAG: M48 family metallopeptidase [Betaproteobacteria bacterium]
MLRQLVDQLDLFRRPERSDAEAARAILLGGRAVPYRFERRRRRSFALAVNHDGLRVLAPMRAPMREVEAFLQEKSGWITRKLDEWAARGRPATLLGRSGESLPLFGRTLALEVVPGARAVMLHEDRVVVRTDGDACILLKDWIRARALEAFSARAAYFAARIDLPPPPVALTDARTRWGSCSARGRIRIAWRLAHLEPALSDYVIAHEVAHLREMNHSRRFWVLVETLYPDARSARKAFKRAAAAIPLL